MVQTQFLLAAVCATAVLAYPRGKTFHVKYPESIQTVINGASGGDKIIVEAGTYKEQLLITKNGITLIGKDATIIPPDTPVTNDCTDLAGPGTQAGICIAGSEISYKDQDFDGEHKRVTGVGKPVKDASVSGFTVEGFSGLNIAVLGALDADVKRNTVSNGPQYGILTVGSKRTDIKHNVVKYTAVDPRGNIAICMDDLSTVEIANNDISGYYIALCVQTAGADIHDNTVHDSCVGAFVDPNIVGAKIHDNTFSNTPSWCNPDKGIAGVFVAGAKDTVIRSNTMTGIKNSMKGGGIVIIDIKDPATGVLYYGSSGTNVQKNTLSDNDVDIYVDSAGPGNVFKKNTCTASYPAGLCSST